MNRSEPGFRMRLRRDMTRYHAALKAGAEGVVAVPAGRSALFNDRYVRCAFGDVELDILFSDVEVVDERWLAWQEGEKRLLDEALRDHVATATLVLGRRGGFQQLEVSFSNGRPNEVWKRRRDADPVALMLRERGVLRERKER